VLFQHNPFNLAISKTTWMTDKKNIGMKLRKKDDKTELKILKSTHFLA
jgi:hypothetical protein